MQNQRTRVSGHLAVVKRKRGDQWYAGYRGPDGRTVQTRLGAVWKRGRGRVEEGFLTERMAQDKLNDLLADARRGLLPERDDPSGATVKDSVEEWLRFVEHENGARATTIREYRTAIYKHFVPVFGDDRLEDVTTKRLEAWKAQLLSSARSRAARSTSSSRTRTASSSGPATRTPGAWRSTRSRTSDG
jgi:hypothetical protein